MLTLAPASVLLHLLVLPLVSAGDTTVYGPVFEEQPVDTIYPEESPEDRITMNCRARANPPAAYNWRLNNSKLEESEHYTVVGGNLVINSPNRSKHVGNYSCVASNSVGTVISREASLQFGYLDFFSSEEREAVRVKEGLGAVLLCAPPHHYPAELSFRWMLNEFPTFITPDKRRFVSQRTGNLYLAKVDRSDSGNYSCFVSSPSISKSVFSKFIPLVPLPERPIKKFPADIIVKFNNTTVLLGQNATLECFALGNPVPELRWKKLNGELPANREVSKEGAQLHLYNVQFEDAGNYQCEAINSKGKDLHNAHLSVEAFPEWVEYISSTEKDINSDYTMTCLAHGRPKPHIRWLKNGHTVDRKEMTLTGLTYDDSGMYQCIAENRHGVIYANAELRVIACAPTFEHNPVKTILGARNGRVVMECRPKAAPKPRITWSKGTELLSDSARLFIWEDGSLEILNVTVADEGRYTCFADNYLGKANSTGSLTVTDATRITLAPSNADVTVGENTQMQCAASHDASLDITFVWSLDGRIIDVHRDSMHYERASNGSSNGELLIRNAQLKHAGLYACTAQTPVDNVTASAHLVVRGPPGPPGGVRVVETTDKSVRLKWSRGTDNHSPISKYTIQYRDSFAKDVWKDATTSPADVEGNAEEATVVELIPWTEYEFRVIATNTLGTGEASTPSPKVTTEEAVPVVAPSDVGGGGGSSKELTITWTPVEPQYYYGRNFGYIVTFKAHKEYDWRIVTVADPHARHYIHKDSFIPPYTEFAVKIKAFNIKGEGPYSHTAVIYSAQDAPSEAPTGLEGRGLSATDAIVWWRPISADNVDRYQVKYWREQDDSETGAQRVVSPSTENQVRLEGLRPHSVYLVEVRAYNAAGYGPPSQQHQISTKKPPPSRPPKITGKKFKGQLINIAWEHVEPLANESSIDGYKVLYRQEGHSTGSLYTTSKRSIDLPLHKEGDYVAEVRAHSDGGDGAVASIYISGGGVMAACSLSLLSLLLVTVVCLDL